MDIGFFLRMLRLDSTSGKEVSIYNLLKESMSNGHLKLAANGGKIVEARNDSAMDLLLDWSGTGKPNFVFCTHIDTVPPYISPDMIHVSKGEKLPDGRISSCDDTLITGRGSCDAKGQIFTMLNAALALREEGYKDLGLLLVSGEERGSFGAKLWNQRMSGGKFVLIGEPTDNSMISASKGTKQYEITFFGKACHSGYPENGESAIDTFVDFVNRLRKVEFPEDAILGRTTWNIGELSSDNPHNVLSPEISFRIYFRTTFSSDKIIDDTVRRLCPPTASVKAYGGDEPLEYYHSVPGVDSKIGCFGSDAPQLEKFEAKAIFGPGSILTAHTDREYILLSDIEAAIETEKKIMRHVMENNIF